MGRMSDKDIERRENMTEEEILREDERNEPRYDIDKHEARQAPNRVSGRN